MAVHEHALATPAYWWSAAGDWVEPPNERRGGRSGVQRVRLRDDIYYVKRQANHLCRTWLHPFGRPTLWREWRNFQVFRRLNVPTPALVAFDMRRGDQGWEAVLVTRALDGYTSLADGLASGLWSSADVARILMRIVDAVAPLHRARRKHGHLYPKEIFVRCKADAVDIALLDLEVSRWRFSRRRAAEADMRRLVRSLLSMGLTAAHMRAMIDRYVRHGLRLSPEFWLR